MGKATFQAVKSKRNQGRGTLEGIFDDCPYIPEITRQVTGGGEIWRKSERGITDISGDEELNWALELTGIRSGGMEQMLGKKGQEAGQERSGQNSVRNPKADRKQSYQSMPNSHFVP